MIYPILTDNNEVSGTFVRSDMKSWHKSRIKKAHFRFCKRYLEIQNKASNIVSRAELGKYPMIIDINEKIQLLTALFNNMRTLKFKSQPIKCVFRYRQSNARRFLPASDYCRARGNQIKSSSTVQTT